MSIKVGIIGCGGITAFSHAPFLLNSDKFCLNGLYDIDHTRANTICEKFRIPSNIVYTNLIEFLSAVDAVIIANGPDSRVELIDSILDKKEIPLLVQKPLAFRKHEVQQLQRLLDYQKPLMVLPFLLTEPFSQYKSYLEKCSENNPPEYCRIRVAIPGPSDYDLDVDRFFGELEGAKSERSRSYGGCLSDMGPYALAMFFFLFGKGELLQGNLHPSPGEETLALLSILRENTSMRCTIEAAWGQLPGRSVCDVFWPDRIVSLNANGRISEEIGGNEKTLFRLKSNDITPVLPRSPTSGQEKWLDSIHEQSNPFRDTVQAALWSSNVIANLYLDTDI